MNRDLLRDAGSIRHQALLALAANRTPGFHYPGHFLGCHWPRIGDADLDAVIPDGPRPAMWTARPASPACAFCSTSRSPPPPA